MHISNFDYELPVELIAQEPLANREASRMLVVDRQKRSWIDAAFIDLPEFVRCNDVLVINNTRVFPARLIGRRIPSNGRVELLLVREIEPLVWQALVRPAARLRQGAQIQFSDSRLQAELLDRPGHNLRRVRFYCEGSWETVLNSVGETPLPPYITRPASAADRERYQTLFARETGAIAAPTAGLHFTPEIIERIKNRGARFAEITLHVGYGTFEPVRADDIETHVVAPEQFEVTSAAAESINQARANGARVIAIGTTTTRALEAASNEEGKVEPARKNAALTILPGYRFRATDAMLTNFHLPRSSLLLLVSAFADHELILRAYAAAVEQRYRFYSYGDCMLLI